MKIDKVYDAICIDNYKTITAGNSDTLTIEAKEDIIITRIRSFVETITKDDVFVSFQINDTTILSAQEVTLSKVNEVLDIPIKLNKGDLLYINVKNNHATDTASISFIAEGYKKTTKPIDIKRASNWIEQFKVPVTIAANSTKTEEIHFITNDILITDIQIEGTTDKDVKIRFYDEHNNKHIQSTLIAPFLNGKLFPIYSDTPLMRQENYFAPIFLEKNTHLFAVIENGTGTSIDVNLIFKGVNIGGNDSK